LIKYKSLKKHKISNLQEEIKRRHRLQYQQSTTMKQMGCLFGKQFSMLIGDEEVLQEYDHKVTKIKRPKERHIRDVLISVIK
jgi:hypothetical protein